MADMNPHKKGTMEYLDYATAQHTKAIAPKKKKKKKVMGMKPINPVGLAASSIEGKQGKTATAFNDFMSGGPRVRR